MDRTRLEQSQWLAEKGITVFIIEANSKRPLGGHSWYERQTQNPAQIAEWFEEYPNCNYGCHLGSGHVVVDLDVKPDVDGVKAFEDICRENGIEDFLLELSTLMVRTPSGGYHLYFKTPFPCANKNNFPDGIDVRGAIGYVVGPGSEIVETGRWEVLDPDVPIMDAPDWLLEYLEEPGKKDPNHNVPLTDLDQPESIEQATEFLKEREPAMQGNNGDDHTYETINWLRDFGLSEEMAFEVLNESGWNERCDPPWADNELEIKIRNSYEYGQNRPGCKSEVYTVRRLSSARPAGGYVGLSIEQMDALFRPKSPLELVVDNDAIAKPVEDDGIPIDVLDDEDRLDQFESDDQLWYDVNDFVGIDKVREYVVSDWLIAHGITGLIAARGTGKSTIALDLAFHLACDMDWWNVPTMKDWNVIYICGEDDEGMILNARAWTQHHGDMPMRDRFLVARDIISLTDETVLARRLEEMVTWAKGRRCVIILDTWSRATAGLKSNAQEEMEIAVKRAEQVAKKMGGPLVACFHPPKDGRLTIRGSAVQEDMSSGLWELEKVADGITLTFTRAKGSGEGNWRKFRIEKVDVGGKDAHGKPLQGIVPIKIAGTEDSDRPDFVEALRQERNAWALAVKGCLDYPNENNSIEAIKPNRQQVSEMICDMWNTQNENPESMDFVIQYMADLVDAGVTRYTTSSGGTVYKKLDQHFFKATNRIPVKFPDGTELIIDHVKGTKNTEHFVLRKTSKPPVDNS